MHPCMGKSHLDICFLTEEDSWSSQEGACFQLVMEGCGSAQEVSGSLLKGNTTASCECTNLLIR